MWPKSFSAAGVSACKTYVFYSDILKKNISSKVSGMELQAPYILKEESIAVIYFLQVYGAIMTQWSQ